MKSWRSICKSIWGSEESPAFCAKAAVVMPTVDALSTYALMAATPGPFHAQSAGL
jgi:hypothetical protein